LNGGQAEADPPAGALGFPEDGDVLNHRQFSRHAVQSTVRGKAMVLVSVIGVQEGQHRRDAVGIEKSRGGLDARAVLSEKPPPCEVLARDGRGKRTDICW